MIPPQAVAVIALVCAGLLGYDNWRSLRTGTFRFGGVWGVFFGPIRRDVNPIVFWIHFACYGLVSLVGFALSVLLVGISK